MGKNNNGYRKNKSEFNLKKLNILLVHIRLLITENYHIIIMKEMFEYMKSPEIKINIQVGNGNKEFEVYTMDLTKKYIEINADYRS